MRNSISKFSIFALLTLSVACSDDEPARVLELSQGTEPSKVVSYNQEEFTISLLSSGEWKASVVGENSDWLVLLDNKGSGNHELSVLVDPNTTNERRKGNIEITDGERSLTYEVSQGTIFEAVEDNSEINYGAFGSRKVPLGFAIRIKKSNNKSLLPTKQIFNLKQWDKLSDEEKAEIGLNDEFVVQQDPNELEIDLMNAQQFSANSQDIKANLKVSVGFGLAKLGLDGGFSLHRKSSDKGYAYRLASDVPFTEYGIDNYEIYMQKALMLDSKDEQQAKWRKQLLGGEFLSIYDKIVASFDENGNVTNQANLDAALRKLDTEFGPVFCHNGTTGGSINLEILANMQTGADTMSINGSLSVGLNFAFSFDGKASASYLKTATDSLSELNVKAKIKGGALKSQNEILVATQKVIKNPSDSENNTAALLEAVTAWRSSFSDADSKGKSNTVVTKYELEGIWTLFRHDNETLQNAMVDSIKSYMRKHYPNDKSIVVNKDGREEEVETCPYLVNIQLITE